MNITQSKAEEDRATNSMDNTLATADSTPNLQSGYVELNNVINLRQVHLEIVKEGGLKVLYQYIRPIQYGGR